MAEGRVSSLEWHGQIRQPIIAKCKIEACGFVWPCAYTPMEITKIAPLMRAASCPICGNKGAFLA